MSDEQMSEFPALVGVYCRQSKERLGGQMFGRRRGVLSVLSLIYILWYTPSPEFPSPHKRRINIEEKAKVVAAVWVTEFIH